MGCRYNFICVLLYDKDILLNLKAELEQSIRGDVLRTEHLATPGRISALKTQKLSIIDERIKNLDAAINQNATETQTRSSPPPGRSVP